MAGKACLSSTVYGVEACGGDFFTGLKQEAKTEHREETNGHSFQGPIPSDLLLQARHHLSNAPQPLK